MRESLPRATPRGTGAAPEGSRRPRSPTILWQPGALRDRRSSSLGPPSKHPMLFDFTRLLFRGGYVVPRWSSPTAKKADIAWHSMRVIKHLSAQREAKRLQVFLPHLHH